MARNPEHRFGSADEFARALRSAVPAGDVVVPGPAARQMTASDDGTNATRDFGPRPPRPDPVTQQRRRLPLVVVVGLSAAGMLYLVRSTMAEDGTNCAHTEKPVVDGAQVVRGDPEGDGCSTYGLYYPQVVSGEERMILRIEVDGEQKRFALGSNGDQVFVGDWDCDDVDTPAVYRKGTGQVEYYGLWPEEHDQRYEPDDLDSEAAGGTATLRRGHGNVCDQVEVTAPQ
jgi:hypothetical protein